MLFVGSECACAGGMYVKKEREREREKENVHMGQRDREAK